MVTARASTISRTRKVSPRRSAGLNRTEYANPVRDLFGIEVDPPSSLLSADVLETLRALFSCSAFTAMLSTYRLFPSEI